MKTLSKEDAQKVTNGLIGMAALVVVIAVVAFLAAGVTAFLWAAGIGGGVVGLSFLMNLPELRQQRLVARRAHIAQLEAANGMRLYADGTCHKCGTQLVLGAKYCTKCGTSTEVHDHICETCGSRNPEDAEYCCGCGRSFTKIDKALSV